MDDGLDEDSGEDVVDINTEQHPGFMASAWSFITTFFTSLIPEGPPQVGNWAEEGLLAIEQLCFKVKANSIGGYFKYSAISKDL